ncbi:MAG TPA: stalk domain-containing protein [Caldisericia bacterium]|nr:stalk domain-containing protein [Caldisericia bacterium]HPF48751.1 stalk domain-containing protein [Caldisericia bacterium]HPI83589.1 stalk domain-containing protein [Caldisericia bacterium]HPQ93206.1 stalk domain-containing protein [Caldisericia bacterium]HRV74961.1 stalk domain-containing protein [Caldisericia bacterium]
MRILSVILSLAIAFAPLFSARFVHATTFEKPYPGKIILANISEQKSCSFSIDGFTVGDVFEDADSQTDYLVWDSPVDLDKPLDIDNVYVSHDNVNIHFKITLHTRLDELEGDPFISIAIDTDLNRNTGMPKAHGSSYNEGGEDFFARFSTGYGYEKFILDRWDDGRGDTVETGGLGGCKAEGKEIEFLVPRRAIGNPSKLDFLVMGRLYQATNPDISPAHIIYNLVSDKIATDVGVEKIDGKCVVTFPGKSMIGVTSYHLKTNVGVFPISLYVVPDVDAAKKASDYFSEPEPFKRLDIARVNIRNDGEKLWFTVDFWDGLSVMCNYDFKIRVLCDTGAMGGISEEMFTTGKEDFILEVMTESERTVSKLYSAKRGMGYNQPSLTDVKLDTELGRLTFSCKLSRLDNPEKMKAFVVAGGWKAPESDWDRTDTFEIESGVTSGEETFTLIETDQVDTNAAFDIGKIEVRHDSEKVYFRIGLDRNIGKQESDGVVHILMNTDMDTSTGLPPSASNPGGEDHLVTITLKPDGTECELSKLSGFSGLVKVADCTDTKYDGSTLTLSINRDDIDNTEEFLFTVESLYLEIPGSEDYSTKNLRYSLKGDNDKKYCELFVSLLSAKEGDANVKLMWQNPTSEFLGINIYRSTDGGEFKKLNSSPLESGVAEYTDTGVSNGRTYQYYLRVICSDGQEGSKSLVVRAKPKSASVEKVVDISPKEIDFGSNLETEGLHESVLVINRGPGDFFADITPTVDWLRAEPARLELAEGEQTFLHITVTKRLISGDWNGTVDIKGDEGGFHSVPVSLSVPRSTTHTKFVRNLYTEPGEFSITIHWSEPSYNLEQLVGYEIVRTESYSGSGETFEESFTVEANVTGYLDENLELLSAYTYSVTPIYPSGKGIPRIAEGRPAKPNVLISMQIGAEYASLNGKLVKLDAAPFIASGRTMVPFRFIGEALGAIVSYEAESKTAVFTRGRRVVRIPIGKTYAIVDGKQVQLDTPAVIVSGRTFVPIRFVADAFDATTDWDASTKTVTIKY